MVSRICSWLSRDIRNDSSWLYKAEEEIRHGLRDDPSFSHGYAALAVSYMLHGRSEQARSELELNVFATLTAAGFYAVLGDAGTAIEWLERSVRNGDYRRDWLARDSALESVREDRRFQQILHSLANRVIR